MSPIFEARGLSKSFGATRAVDGIDLVVAPGEIIGLVGENGPGKTTLLWSCTQCCLETGELALPKHAVELLDAHPASVLGDRTDARQVREI